MLKKLLKESRSYRRFDHERKVSRQILMELVELTRYTPSAANRQRGRYLLVTEEQETAAVFSCLRWAAFLQDWDGPEEQERPSAYVIMLAPQKANIAFEEGIKAQTLLLGAAEKGMGGCILENIDRKRLEECIEIPAGYRVSLILALGYPRETVVVQDISASEDTRYYRDAAGIHYVPKLKTEALVLPDTAAE